MCCPGNKKQQIPFGICCESCTSGLFRRKTVAADISLIPGIAGVAAVNAVYGVDQLVAVVAKAVYQTGGRTVIAADGAGSVAWVGSVGGTVGSTGSESEALQPANRLSTKIRTKNKVAQRRINFAFFRFSVIVQLYNKIKRLARAISKRYG